MVLTRWQSGNALVLNLNAFLRSRESLVNLNNFAFAAERVGCADRQRFADTVAHEPSAFQRNAQRPRKLVRTDALLAAANHMDRIEPIAHLDMAVFEDGPDFHGELLAAGIALIEADPVGLARQRARLPDDATMGAVAPVSPKPRLDIGISGGFVIEVRGGENGRGHGKISLPSHYTLYWSRQV